MKKLWDKLAKKNSKYFINSDYGQNITEKDFNKSGWEDYFKLIHRDRILNKFFNEDIKPSERVRGKGSTILDLGCGTGRLTFNMPEDFYWTIGTDISGEMIKQANDWLVPENLDTIKFLETDGYTLPLGDNLVDVAFSYLVFQHMRTKEMVESNFKEVFRVLKPGGIFKVRIRTDEVRQDKWWSGVAYTEQSIGLLIKKMGYEILKTEAVEDYGLWLWLKKPIDMK